MSQVGRALTPRPGRELPAAERMLGADGLATLKAAIDRHKCVAAVQITSARAQLKGSQSCHRTPSALTTYVCEN